jgi:hypothetical protein
MMSGDTTADAGDLIERRRSCRRDPTGPWRYGQCPRRPRVTQQIEYGQLDRRHFHPASIRLAILNPRGDRRHVLAVIEGDPRPPDMELRHCRTHA